MEYDVVALGELLVDFIQTGRAENGVLQFAANPGGAPCNVLAFLARQGRKTGFIGKVGGDVLGRYLVETVERAGIDCRGVVVDPSAQTTQAFVATDDQGERSFSFFRNPGADCLLTADEVDKGMTGNTKIFHFGSLSMTHAQAREATRQAVVLAKEHSALLSFDPNYRPALWDDPAFARAQMEYGCSVCDFLKIEASELSFLTGIPEELPAVEKLMASYPISLVTVTAGAAGAAAYTRKYCVRQPAFSVPQPVDTTGAGDAFCGGCLAFLLEHDVHSLTEQDLHQMLRVACAGAAITVGRRGALLSMPSGEEIASLLK